MTWATLVAAIILVTLVVYTLTGGADFGGGVWDLLASGKRASRQRQVIDNAIGPIWEANHVWLIVVIVLMFVCFPSAFAAVSTALHIPLTLMLMGIVLRGTAFVFRHYDDPALYRQWSSVFAVASVATPFFLGVSLGAVASGTMRIVDGQVQTDFFSEWLAPFPLAVGVFTVSLFALLAATYLAVEAHDDAIRGDFRWRGIVAAVFTAGFAYLSLALSHDGAPHVYAALTAQWWSLPFQILAGLLGTGIVVALFRYRPHIARACAVALVVLVEAGWAAGHVPYVIPPDLTIAQAAAPDAVLRVTLIALVCGGMVLVPSFVFLYSTFKGQDGVFRLR